MIANYTLEISSVWQAAAVASHPENPLVLFPKGKTKCHKFLFTAGIFVYNMHGCTRARAHTHIYVDLSISYSEFTLQFNILLHCEHEAPFEHYHRSPKYGSANSRNPVKRAIISATPSSLEVLKKIEELPCTQILENQVLALEVFEEGSGESS